MTSVLAFDTSQSWCTVAICIDSEIFAFSSEYLPRGHTQVLPIRILEALKKAHALLPQQIADYAEDDFYVLVGTGTSKVIPYLDELQRDYETVGISPEDFVRTLCRLAPTFLRENYTCEPFYIKPPIYGKTRT